MNEQWGNPVFTFRLPADLMQRVDRVAERLGMNRRQVVERCLENAVPEAEKFAERCSSPIWRIFFREFSRIDEDLEPDDLALFEHVMRSAADYEVQKRQPQSGDQQHGLPSTQ